MKNLTKLLGIIAFTAVIGFGTAGCESPTGSTTGKTLTSITLNTDSVKKAYIQNETLDLVGLIVTANYSDGSKAAVTDYTADPASGTTLSTTGSTTVTVSYTEGAVTKTADFSVTVAAKALSGITAEYTSTTHHVYTFTPLNSLKDHLTVTAQYNDGTSATLEAEDYELSGNLTVGTSIITASYTEGSITKTDTFDVTVTDATLDSIAVAFDQDDETIYTSTPLDKLKQYLTVTATYTFTGSQETLEETLEADEYELSGELTVGTPTITVNYGGKTGNFTPTVTAVALVSITAQYGTATVYTSTPSDNLKQYLTVKAVYNDGNEKTLTANEYTLSGTLTVGTPTITASYTEGGVTKTATFTPAVTAVVLDSITAAYTGNDVEINSDVDDLKTALTVTAHYNDGSTETASNYSLSGTLTAIGQKTITASYTDGGITKTDTFTVTVVCTNHDWQWKPYTPATCTTAGSEIQTCSLCGITGETRTTSIDPNAHDYQQRSTATETEDGEEGMICTHDPSHKQGSTTIAYATGTAGLSFSTWDSPATYYRVSKGTATGDTIVIPAYWRSNANSPYLPVTEIVSGIFANNITITSVTFAEGSQLLSIGRQAFQSCSNLTSISIPARVTSIGEDAFISCTSLTSVTFAEGSQLETIDYRAFYNCRNLTSITIPASVTSIGEIAFATCRSLTSITIPANVTSIGESAFRDCDNLTSVNILASITTIGDGMFNQCTSLASINIPTSVTSIGYSAFGSCRGLISITIPASVTSIGERAFLYCSSLTSVTFQGTIASDLFDSTTPFPGDLRAKFYATNSANGTPGTYTRPSGSSNTWTKQP